MPSPRGDAGARDGPGYGPTLALWMALIVACHALLWASGLRPYALAEAVERGAAKIESRGIGEVREDQIRKAIRTQHETLPFWTALTLIDDFAIEPAAPAARALAVAVLLSGLAALTGRPVRFPLALAESASAQGVWVLGLAVRTALMLALRTPEVDTSAVLALPAGAHPASLWVALRQVDAFVLLGWAVLAWLGWRRGQASLFACAFVCALLALGEATIRIAFALVLEGGMRLTLIPG